MKRTLAFLFLLLLFPTAQRAQTQEGAALPLYLPALRIADNADLGMAFSNPTLAAASVELLLRGFDGKRIEGAGITNPVTITLPAKGQLARRATEVFGSGVAGANGWIEAVPSTAAIKGFFLFFDAGVNYIDGAALVQSPSNRLVFSKVSAETSISFANTTAQELSRAGLSLFDNDGRVVEKVTMPIGPHAGFAGRLSDLIPNAAGFSGYAILEAAATPFSASPEALVGFAAYRNRSDMAALAAVPPQGLFRRGFLPHFVAQGGYTTSLGLVNPTTQAQRVRITAGGLEAGGQTMNPAPAAVERSIPPFGRLDERAEQLFGFSGNAVITGYIRYEVLDAGAGLAGYAEIGGSDGLLLSTVSAQGEGLSDFYFSQIAQDDNFYTGVALFNPNALPATINIGAFAADGAPLAATSVTLDAGARRARQFSEVFPAVARQSSGYIHVTSSRPIYALELFGSARSGAVLASVPAQGVQLRPQGSGRPVSAARGASVISGDGSITASVPPGALSADTPIRIDSIAISGLPNPAADHRVIAAVDAQPAGTRFNIPIRLTFSLAAELAPDTKVPLLLFNSQTRRYDSTDFFAIVDDTGRTASAEITHFSTYAAALPGAQLLNVSGLTPSNGSAGSAVTINGSGFAAAAADNVVTFAGPDNSSLRATVSEADSGRLVATVPAAAVTGYVTVRVASRTSIGVVFTVPEVHPRPSITSISPNNIGVGAASADVEIAGSGFRRGSAVTYDGATVTPTFVDSTLLLLSLGASQLKPAVHRIAVSNPAPGGGDSEPAEFIVSYPPPVISSVTPSAVDEGAAAQVTITGTGFTEASTVLVDGAPNTSSFINSTTLRIAASVLSSGARAVAVANPAPGGGTSRTIPLFVRPLIRVSGIFLLDPDTGRPASEIVVNEGNSIRPAVMLVDSSGSILQNHALEFSSADASVASIDAAGNIHGRRPGFSTLTITAGGTLAAFTVTVVGVDGNVQGVAPGAGVAQDLGRNLFLASTQNHTILRTPDLKAQAEVYAGVSRTAGLKNDVRLLSWFRGPSFLALNQGEGSLYVADAANNVIRRVLSGPAGIVETVAGSGIAGAADGPAGAATFSNPQGVAFDRLGQLWVADSGNNTIRRIDVNNGTVVTIAGQAGTTGFSDGRGSAARFSSPMGIAFEAETRTQTLARNFVKGPLPPIRVIVADAGNGAIRRVSENGDVETLQSASAVSALSLDNGKSFAAAIPFAMPTGVAVDPLGNIFVTEASTGSVKAILTNGTVVSAVQPKTFTNPHGIAITETGKVIVTGSNRPVAEIRFGEPQISSISPTRISNKGGERIVITGGNFAPDTAVVIGGVAASNITIENTQRISFIAPAAPSGLTTLSVQNRGGIAQTSLAVEAAAPHSLPPGYITTIAGGSTFAGDGSRANQASIAPPWGIAVDAGGNVIIAETALHRIRQVSASTNTILTVAGSGQSGFAGDGGIALAAALSNPVGVAVDGSGNLYISDTSNDRVRKVDSATGSISTIAGNGLKGFAGDNGPGPAASLFDPFGIAVDSSGNVYIADTANSRIRKVAAGTGVITTVAGNGQKSFSGDNGPATAAALNFPHGVAVDAAGNVYIADTFNFRIRKVQASTGAITTVAGNGVRGFSGDNGSALSASIEYAYGVNVDVAGNIYIADTFNERVRRVDVATGIIATVAGNGTRGFAGDSGPATSAALADPVTVTIDGAGNLYIVDTFNFRVRKVAAGTGVITTVAGNGSQSLPGDNGAAVFAALTLPSGIAVDSLGNTYIADTFNQQIRKVTAATGVITAIAGTGSRGFSGDNGLAASATFANPNGVAVDSIGNIYIADTDNNRVRKIAAGTTIISTLDTGLQAPSGIAVDGSGNVYVADTGNNRVRKIETGTGSVTTIAAGGTVAKPAAVAVDSAGNVYVADTAGNRIRKIAAGTGVITTVAGTGARGFSGDNGQATSASLAEPYGLALDNAGRLIIADSFNNRIRRVDLTTGIITTIAGGGSSFGDNGPGTAAALNNPRAVAMDLSGNLLIADWFNGRIRLVRGP